MAHTKFQDQVQKIFKGFGHGRFLGHVTKTIFMKGCSTQNLALFGQAVSEKKVFENSTRIHVYSLGAGTDNPLGSNVISKMSLVLRKPVFGVSDQVQHKPGCTATEDG